MLYRAHLIAALEERREEFARFERALRDEVGGAAAALRSLSGKTADEVRRSVTSSQGEPRVTLPSDELDSAGAVVLPFGEAWRSHEEARRWALRVLENRVTFAADGSQIFPGREATVPVAAVQIACFENPHTPSGDYTKESFVSVLTPAELLGDGRAYESPDQLVGVRRFELEAEAVCAFLERRRGWRARGERMPLAFFDNTLVISSRRKDTEVLFSKRYTAALSELLRLSRECEVPVVGYVDNSYAPDIRDLLEALQAGARTAGGLFDAKILRARAEGAPPLLRSWGDRTIFWHCRRPNLAASFYDEAGEPLVGFVYLQTTADCNPARLDIPAWAQASGLVPEVADVVRAECVVGNGYPYAIETADQAAVMSANDRSEFLHLVEEFAARNGLEFAVARKAASKGRRR